MKISVSFLKSNYSLDETIKRINDIKSDNYIHVDILDGEYVNSSKTDLESYIKVLKTAVKPLDIHLMVNHPIEYIKKLIFLKPKIITVHWDCLDNLNQIADILKSNNIKMGIALNPNDDIYVLNDYEQFIDLVLIMSVFPGKGGQKFLRMIPYKLKHLKKLFNNNVLIEVDGGINNTTIFDVKEYVDLVVCGSYICCSENYEEKLKSLLTN